MKASIILIIVCALVITLIGVATFMMHREAHALMGRVGTMLTQIEAGSIMGASQSCDSLLKDWEKTEKAWQTLISHAELHIVTDYLTAIKSYLRYGRVYLAHANCAQLYELLRAIDADLFPHAGNVF